MTIERSRDKFSEEARSVREKWCVYKPSKAIDLYTDFFVSNETGLPERNEAVGALAKSGGVIGVGAPDKFLSLAASMKNPTGLLYADINAFFSAAYAPYLYETILRSGGIEREAVRLLYDTEHRQILWNLFKGAGELIGYDVDVKKLDLFDKSDNGRLNHESYLQGQYWLRQSNLEKLYYLVSNGKATSFTADLCDPQVIKSAVNFLDDELSVIDVSNIAYYAWGGENIGIALNEAISLDDNGMLLLGSGSIPYHQGLVGPSDFSDHHKNTDLWNEFYSKRPWEKVDPAIKGSKIVLHSWITRGIWPIVPRDRIK